MSITFHNADISYTLKNKRQLKQFIEEQIVKSSNCQIVKFSIVFCSDAYLLNINQKFLNHNYYTDIITFPLVQTKTHLEAEIYISIERVKENAGKFKVQRSKTKAPAISPPLEGGARRAEDDELHRVIFHGILHLLGFKDKSKADKAAMRQAEDKWLKKFSSITTQ